MRVTNRIITGGLVAFLLFTASTSGVADEKYIEGSIGLSLATSHNLQGSTFDTKSTPILDLNAKIYNVLRDVCLGIQVRQPFSNSNAFIFQDLLSGEIAYSVNDSSSIFLRHTHYTQEDNALSEIGYRFNFKGKLKL
jgi:hypothetical protein